MSVRGIVIGHCCVSLKGDVTTQLGDCAQFAGRRVSPPGASLGDLAGNHSAEPLHVSVLNWPKPVQARIGLLSGYLIEFTAVGVVAQPESNCQPTD